MLLPSIRVFEFLSEPLMLSRLMLSTQLPETRLPAPEAVPPMVVLFATSSLIPS